VVSERLGAWERERIGANSRSVDNALTGIERALAAKPGPEEIRRLKGRLETAAGDVKKAPDPTGERQRQLTSLTVWRDALDPSTKLEARPRLKALLLADRPYQPAQLCKAFFKQYESVPDILPDARQVLARTRTRSISDVSAGDQREVD